MKKKIYSIFIILSVIMLFCACSEEESSRHRDRDRDRETETAADAVVLEEDDNIGEIVDMITDSQDDSDSETEEDPYAIYERFLIGEEPLYFMEDVFFNNNSYTYRYTVEAGKPYEFYDICNIINMVYNSASPVNELSNNISYSYIDCGADGDAELALLFHGLEDYEDPEDVTMVIKNINGRLVMCYLINPYYRETWELSNIYGVEEYFNASGTGYTIEARGYINSDGIYNNVYSMANDYNTFEYGMPDSFYFEIPMDEVVVFKIYSFGRSDKEYTLVEVNNYASGESSVDINSLTNAVADALPDMEFVTYEEIQAMIASREAEIGLTDEIKNGPAIEWIPLDEKNYDLIYGVEAEPGVSDRARAIEAYRRFLSDPGHFKEILATVVDDGLAVSIGIVDGFFIKDLDNDDIPELLIGLYVACGGGERAFIYTFDTESGRVNLSEMIGEYGAYFGCEEDVFNGVVSAYPEIADSLFYSGKYTNNIQEPLSIGYNSAGQLVWFSKGADLGTYREMYYKYFGENDAIYYYENGGLEDYDIRRPYYETSGSKEDAINALQGYRPFLFYDITEENINRYVVEDYLNAGMENYSRQDVLDDIDRMERFYDGFRWNQDIYPTGYFDTFLGYNIDYLMQLLV